MEAEKQKATEAAEAAKRRAGAAAEREAALRKQQEERVNQLRQDARDNTKAAAEKQTLIARLDKQLQAKLVGCSGHQRFMQVLRVFGVALDSNEETAVAKAYRKAMVMFHPDRAQRKGESWQKVVEAEEIYKLVQNEYQRHQKLPAGAQFARPPPQPRPQPPQNNYYQPPKMPSQYPHHKPAAPSQQQYSQPAHKTYTQAPQQQSQNQYSSGRYQPQQPSQPHSTQTWKCRVCTKVNGLHDTRCKVCNRPQGHANTGETARQEAAKQDARRQYESLQRQAREDAERIREEQRKRRQDAAAATASARMRANAEYKNGGSDPHPSQPEMGESGAGWRRFFRW